MRGLLDQARVGDAARVCERRVLGRHSCGFVWGCYAVAVRMLEGDPGAGGNGASVGVGDAEVTLQVGRKKVRVFVLRSRDPFVVRASRPV